MIEAAARVSLVMIPPFVSTIEAVAPPSRSAELDQDWLVIRGIRLHIDLDAA